MLSVTTHPPTLACERLGCDPQGANKMDDGGEMFRRTSGRWTQAVALETWVHQLIG